MIKEIRYKGQLVNLNDIEIAWEEENFREWWRDGQPRTKIGTIEDYGQSQYSYGYDEGYDVCASTETGNEGW